RSETQPRRCEVTATRHRIRRRYGIAETECQTSRNTVVEVPAGTPIEEALDSHNIPRQGYSVSVNGLGAGPATALGDGDVVTLVPKVEGGCL
ncbi:MAG: MoaD/ThiS family protein, partial [Lentisphaerae bacterium]|nr:MoaD/ThiS family protein [Lentisphaerota bacterium]